MRCCSKMFLSIMLALATALFTWGTGAGAVFAAQDDAGDEYSDMTEEEYEAYMIEYAEWEAADQETDASKSGAMLIEFMRKNPGSRLAPYA